MDSNYDATQRIEASGNFEKDKANIMSKRQRVDGIMKKIEESFAKIDTAWKDANDPEGNKYKEQTKQIIGECISMNAKNSANDAALADALTELSQGVNTQK